MKTKHLHIRISDKELKMIERNCNKAQMSKTDFVIKACENEPITVIDGLQDVARQIHYLNNNINQLVVLAHQGKISVVDLSKFREEIDKIWQSSNSVIKNV